MKKNWRVLLLVFVFIVGILEFIPAPPVGCYADIDCIIYGPEWVCDTTFGTPGVCLLPSGGGGDVGDSCTFNSDCSSGDCGYAINCDKSVSTCSQYCQPSLDECSRAGFFSGYDTYQIYSNWICLGSDLGGRACTSSNVCSTVGSYYCSSAGTWISGTPPASCDCSNVATTNVFKVKNAAGEEIFRVDTDGDVAFQGGLFYDSDINEVTSSQFKIVRSGSNSEFRVMSSNKIAVYEGTKYASQSSIALTTGGDFVVKNSAGTIVFMITDQGNIYAKGTIASGCGCEAGTYSNPTDLVGNYILGTTSGTSDYAIGYCAQIHGCQTVTAFSTTTTSRYACRCDYTNSFGCSGGSCTTASSSWPSYSSITCA